MIKFSKILSEIKLSGDKTKPTLIQYSDVPNWVYAKDNKKIEFKFEPEYDRLLVHLGNYDLEDMFDNWLENHNIIYNKESYSKHSGYFINNVSKQLNITSDKNALRRLDEIKLSGNNRKVVLNVDAFGHLYYAQNKNIKFYAAFNQNWIDREGWNEPMDFKDVLYLYVNISRLKKFFMYKDFLEENNILYKVEKKRSFRILTISNPGEYFDISNENLSEIKLSGDGPKQLDVIENKDSSWNYYVFKDKFLYDVTYSYMYFNEHDKTYSVLVDWDSTEQFENYLNKLGIKYKYKEPNEYFFDKNTINVINNGRI